MKPGDIIQTKKGTALYLGGDTKDEKNYKFPVFTGLTQAGGQGLTFRFLDEVVGTARGALSPDLTMQQGRDLERAAFERIQKEEPLKAVGAEMAGAMIPSILSFGTTAPLSATGIGTAATRAGLAGLVYGAGGAEGYTERAGPAVTSGGISAVGGAAMQTLARPIAKVSKEIKASFQKPEGVGQKAAQALIKQALDYDKTDITSAIKFITDRAGKNYTMSDIGPNTRAYLDAVNVIPGPAKRTAQDFLQKRNEGMIARISSDLKDAFGAKGSYFDEYKALESARRENGKILYDKAMEKQIPINNEFVELLKRPSAQNAFKKAYELANESGVTLPRINLVNGQMLTEKGNPVKAIDTKLLHWMKLSLDDAIYTGRSPASGVGSTQLNLQKSTKDNFLKYMDTYNPTYKRARDEWAGKTSVMDKMELGRIFDKPSQNVDELAAEIATMSKSEVEAFRTGVLNNIVEKMEKGVSIDGRGTNLAFNIIKTPRSRRLLRLTFEKGKQGEDKFNKFISNLTDEIRIKDTSNLVVGNSATAGRQEAVSAIKSLMQPSDIQNLSPVGLLYSMLKADNPQLQEKAALSAANELARILTETNPTALKMIAKELSDKKTFKGILKTYIPKGMASIIKAPISPGAVAAPANILNIPNAFQTPDMQTLIERLNRIEQPQTQ